MVAKATNGKHGSAGHDVILGADPSMQGQARAISLQPRQFSYGFVLRGSPILISRAASPAVLPWEVNFGMHNPHVPRESVAAGEEFFLLAECASGLLLADVVDRILVPREIVRP